MEPDRLPANPPICASSDQRQPMLNQTHLYLVRHGQTRANAEQYIGGSTDDPLTEQGHAQAREVAGYLQQAAEVSAIYTSPLLRARETADHISGAITIEPRVVADLAEWDTGDWERLKYADVPKQPGFKPECLLDPQWAPPGGEPLGHVQSRVVAKIQELADLHSGQSVVVVSHGTALGLALAHWFHEDTGAWTQYRLQNCSITEVSIGSEFELVAANQVSHLTGA